MLSYKGALINGKWTGGENTEIISVLNPSTGKEIGQISACGKDLANKALEAAEASFITWSKLGINERAKHILAFRDVLVAKKVEIMDVLVKETGKVTSNADYDFNMLTDCLNFHLDEVRRNYGTVYPDPDNSNLSYTKYSPVGVVVCVLTWNFPLLNLGYKLGPILATGKVFLFSCVSTYIFFCTLGRIECEFRNNSTFLPTYLNIEAQSLF